MIKPLSDLERSKMRVFLSEYERRKSVNTRYSKRAFSRDLGISHTLFSLIEAGKRPVSEKLAKKLLSEARLPKPERDILSLGLPVDTSYPTQKISLEAFQAISSWKYYAILSLTEVDDFAWDAEWIAARINIKVTEARKLMSQLEALECVARDENGQMRQTGKPIVLENKKSSQAARSYNTELLTKAKSAMDELPFEVRELTSITFVMDPAFLPYASERIRNFRRSLCKELENLGDKSEVYSLCVQLFPLTKVRGPK